MNYKPLNETLSRPESSPPKEEAAKTILSPLESAEETAIIVTDNETEQPTDPAMDANELSMIDAIVEHEEPLKEELDASFPIEPKQHLGKMVS